MVESSYTGTMSELRTRSLFTSKVTWYLTPGASMTDPSIRSDAVLTKLFRGCVSFGSKVGVSLKSTPLLTQTWTCWELATCICVFSRSHSPLLTDLSVRYLLKSYIFNRVCLNMTSRCRDGEAWKTSLSKTTFVSPKKYARGSSIAWECGLQFEIRKCE